MGIASSLFTALSGLSVNETAIDVIGDNIANANTVGFKSSGVTFATQFNRSLGLGSAPDADNGGTNPTQIGLGAFVSAISRDFTQGSVQNTGVNSDLAIQGAGLFIVRDANGQFYTRNGQFQLDSNSQLVNVQGQLVQGYGVTDDFVVDTSALTDLTIPVGSLRVAQATNNVVLEGILSSSGAVATQGTILTSQALTDAGAGGAAITAATLLTDVEDGAPIFTLGQVVTLAGHKGSRTLDDRSLTVGAASTVQDFLDLITDQLGIQAGGSLPGAPGASVSAAGEIVVEGNYGEKNAIDIQPGDITADVGTVDLSFTITQEADGESVFTQSIAFDSLGNTVRVGVTAVLESADQAGTVYRFFVDSPDDSDSSIAIGNGTLTFDSSGLLVATTDTTVAIDRDNTAAVSPMQFTLDFERVVGLASSTSELAATSQDGSAPGTLISFLIDQLGTIRGSFSNGVTRPLGQVALARFTNFAGLVALGNNLYREGPNSGLPVIAQPGSQGVGTLLSGAVELSNTDISQSFVELILASTNFTANSRVISTTQKLTDEILSLQR